MTPPAVGVAVRYAAFAAVATAANLLGQYAVFALYAGFGAVLVALGVGTAVGLVTKYALDARLIFFHQADGLGGHARAFSRYTATGLLTTALFWGVELLVAAASADTIVRLAGGGVGLAVGYILKYQLDRRLVFRETPS